jgi:hypothetical protein
MNTSQRRMVTPRIILCTFLCIFGLEWAWVFLIFTKKTTSYEIDTITCLECLKSTFPQWRNETHLGAPAATGHPPREVWGPSVLCHFTTRYVLLVLYKFINVCKTPSSIMLHNSVVELPPNLRIQNPISRPLKLCQEMRIGYTNCPIPIVRLRIVLGWDNA